MSHSSTFLLVSLLIAVVSATRTLYNAQDISAISLYGPTAVYLPQNCPHTIEFTARARHLPELAEDKIGIFPREIIIDGSRCRADALMIDLSPIGRTDHFPPQWVFEDSQFHAHPVNFTCGSRSLSIRFGYFNDVNADSTQGFLDPHVVYLDFAVIPNTKPFAFCSFAGRRTDGERPLNFAPFPSQRVWQKYHELRKLTHPTRHSPATEVSPEPEESMEAEGSMEPEESLEHLESDGMNDGFLDIGQMDDEFDVQGTDAPGLERTESLADPFRS